MATSRVAPGRPSVRISSARAREKPARAASAAEKTPASRTSRVAETSCQMSAVIGVGSSSAGFLGRAPLLEQLALQAEHHRVLLRLGVVVAEEVQDAVDGEEVDLGLTPVPGLLPLPLRHRGCQHEVTEHALLR